MDDFILIKDAMNTKIADTNKKFGTIEGVIIPSILQMIGVILFLRLGLVLGHVGIFQMSIIISLSAFLLFITGLSLSGIVSNMKMSGGGAYYLISRSLGIEFGGAIGILSCLSQLCSISLCVTGFSLSINEFFPSTSLPVIKAATLTALFLISYISTNLAIKTQICIFIILITSIAAIFFGNADRLAPLQSDSIASTLTFWSAFAMFFPAMTGIESGMSMSGDLKQPSRSIPLGTLFAIVFVYLTYLGIALYLSAFVSPELLRSCPFILYYTSNVGFLIMMGIWAATISSALGVIIGSPRVIQAVAKDGILPRFLSKGTGEMNQPRIATITVFVLGMILTLGTDIDQIIPMLTMSCLVSYGLINWIACFESLMKNPSWRPAIKTHWLISLTGSLGCLIAMFMINAGAAFIAIATVMIFCLWTSKRKIQSNWDDLKYSIFSFFIHRGAIKLSNLEASAKSWRPHILALFEEPKVEKNLAYFAHALNQGKGFLTFGAHAESDQKVNETRDSLKVDLKGFKIPSHVHINNTPLLSTSFSQIIRNYGFGLLRPNTIMMKPSSSCKESAFAQILLEICAQNRNLVILKDDPTRDYLFSDSRRKNKQINLWWRGKYRGNFEFCLSLAYLLQQSSLWPNSKIFIKMIVKDELTKEKLHQQFETYRSDLRIKNLGFAPIVNSNEDFFSNFEAHSQNADLTFLGLKKPDENTVAAEYAEYYQNLLQNTKGVNNIAFAICSEKIEFRNIFMSC
jgi:amino acid transporter